MQDHFMCEYFLHKHNINKITKLKYLHKVKMKYQLLNIPEHTRMLECVYILCSSLSMLQPRISDSLSVCTLTDDMGTLDQQTGLSNCTSSLGGHWGWMCLPPRNSTADKGSAVCNVQYHLNPRSLVNVIR